MRDISLMPISGMNTESEDTNLHREGDNPRHFVRDAVNLNITSSGKAGIRDGVQKVTGIKYRGLWQSPLHGDTFAALDDQWVKVDPETWESEALTDIGEGEVFHEVVNNQVFVSGSNGLYTYAGIEAEPLTIETPPAPMAIGGGTANALDLDKRYVEGTRAFAVSWLRGSKESALSAISTSSHSETYHVTLPMVLDKGITGVRLYMTGLSGTELRRQGTYKAETTTVVASSGEKLGAPAQFQYLSPMPAGRFLKYWRGRIMTARANVLRFSQALNYHLHDERYDFIQMPQRITFVQPVVGGIWVGQTTHVAFLQGSSLEELSIVRKASRAPIPESATYVDSESLQGELGGGGNGAALWLAENGYVIGTSDGQLVELHKGMLRGLTGARGTSVVLDDRAVTAVM